MKITSHRIARTVAAVLVAGALAISAAPAASAAVQANSGASTNVNGLKK